MHKKSFKLKTTQVKKYIYVYIIWTILQVKKIHAAQNFIATGITRKEKPREWLTLLYVHCKYQKFRTWCREKITLRMLNYGSAISWNFTIDYPYTHKDELLKFHFELPIKSNKIYSKKKRGVWRIILPFCSSVWTTSDSFECNPFLYMFKDIQSEPWLLR